MKPVAWHEPNSYGKVTTHKKWALENGWLPLYAAPVQQAEQEPVAWIKLNEDGVYIEDVTGFPVYAAPVQQVDLTDDEIMDLVRDECVDMRWPSTPLFIARAVIAADREKNRA